MSFCNKSKYYPFIFISVCREQRDNYFFNRVNKSVFNCIFLAQSCDEYRLNALTFECFIETQKLHKICADGVSWCRNLKNQARLYCHSRYRNLNLLIANIAIAVHTLLYIEESYLLPKVVMAQNCNLSVKFLFEFLHIYNIIVFFGISDIFNSQILPTVFRINLKNCDLFIFMNLSCKFTVKQKTIL